MPSQNPETTFELSNPTYQVYDFSDEKLKWKTHTALGSVRLQKFNGCAILEMHVKQEKNSKCQINFLEDVIRMHFQVLGRNSCLNNENRELNTVEQGYFNLFYTAKGASFFRLKDKSVHTFELVLDKTFLLSAIGNNHQKIESFLICNTHHKYNFFWEQNQPLTDNLCALINDVKTCSLQGSLRKTYLEAKVIEILEMLFVKKPKCISIGVIPARPPKIKDSLMEKVHMFLENNMSKSITIRDLAQFAGINTSKLKHDFKQAYGTTIFKRLTSLRMKRAHRLLAENDLTVAHVSQTVGYKNPQHFTVAFKKYYGFLPRELNQSTIIDGS